MTAGRPPKPIDWNKVNEMLEAGCHGTEICPYFDLTPESLYERAQKQFGINFSEYSQQIRQKGDANLRLSQYRKALKGDNMMLIWLGKNRLGQSDSPHEVSINAQTIQNFNALMKQISEAQLASSSSRSSKSDLIIDDNIDNNVK